MTQTPRWGEGADPSAAIGGSLDRMFLEKRRIGISVGDAGWTGPVQLVVSHGITQISLQDPNAFMQTVALEIFLRDQGVARCNFDARNIDARHPRGQAGSRNTGADPGFKQCVALGRWN